MALTDPKEIVQQVLANTTNLDVVRQYIAPRATYITLNYNNPDLKKIEPWCGTHENVGPDAIHQVFVDVNRYWTTEAFDVHALFGEGENVAVFGRFRFKANTTGRVTDSPFAVWAKVDNVLHQVTYMQFMEDTLSTAASFKKEGKMTFSSNPDTNEDVVLDFDDTC